MRLPFTAQEFLDLLAVYNAAWWPVVVALWIASLPAAGGVPGRRWTGDRWMTTLLLVQWTWSAVAYHGALFTRINPAAWLFAALFATEAALFGWSGVRRTLSFTSAATRWTRVGRLLIVYALAYPLINIIEHGSITRVPTFGLPCPTTIFSAGLLLRASSPPKRLLIVPIIWSAIGGSAAFLFGIRADYALPVAGAALAAFAWRRPKTSIASAVSTMHRREARS